MIELCILRGGTALKKGVWSICLVALIFCILPFFCQAQTPDRAQAVATLRQQLEARAETITVEFTCQEILETPAEDLFWEALEHTGVPTQGDYIRWHMDKLDYQEAVREEGMLQHYTLTYTPVYHSTAQQEAALTQAVQELLAQLELNGLSDYRKAFGIYDYICKNIVYDEAAQNLSAYDALMTKTAVCQGYATLFYRLALELDLDCRVISGTSKGQRHGWNIVKIRDIYYYVDATWDAGGLRYLNFLVGQDYFFLHARDSAYRTPEFTQAHPISDNNYILRADCTGAHSFTNYRYNGDATCEKDGTGTATCDLCEVTETAVMEGSALGHSFGQYISNKDATCEADGTKTARCIRCEATDTQPDPGSRLPKNGWMEHGGRWYYYRQDTPVTGWLLWGKDWYYLKSSGEMVTGWLLYGSKWYYLGATGVMDTGWLRYGDSWYYLRDSGEMVTGWCQVQGKWYFLDASGTMRTGWFFSGRDWYYLKFSGEMVTGWLLQGNCWYYLDRSGAMVTGSREIGGKHYQFDTNGICLNP